MGCPILNNEYYDYLNRNNGFRFIRPLGEGRRAAGKPRTLTDDAGNVFSLEYDALMRMTKMKMPVSNEPVAPAEPVAHGSPMRMSDSNESGSRTELGFSYDSLGNLVGVTAPNGAQTGLEYDGNNNLVKTTDALGNQTQITRNSDGFPVKAVDPSGKISTCEYDSLKRLKKISLDGNASSYTYDAPSSMFPSRVDFSTFYRTFIYDNMQNITHVEEFDFNDNSLRSLDYTYDALGRASSVTDKEGKVRRNTYDELGRLVETVDINGDITRFEFDVRDNLIKVIDPRGGISHYEYDAVNRLICTTTPEGKVTSSLYNIETVSGKKTLTVTETFADGDKIVTWKNAIGQIEKREFYKRNNDNTLTLEDTCLYTYNPTGNLLSVSSATASILFTYDEIGRKLSETTNYFGIFPFSKTNSYTYNANDSLASYTGSDGIMHSYSYDDANRLTIINILKNGSIVYNNYRWNNPLQMTFPGGAAVHYDYDALMRTTKIESLDPFEQMIAKREYEYNSIGNIMFKKTEAGIYSYEYDHLRFLSKINNPDGTSKNFTYDNLGNRITENGSSEWTYNLDNQLLETPQDTYEYYSNGNLKKKMVSNGTVYEYVWNSQGELAEVKQGSLTIARYSYDPLGRRISKTVNGTTTYFHYNNWKLSGEYDERGKKTGVEPYK
jgi:YD repeat-containing protein